MESFKKPKKTKKHKTTPLKTTLNQKHKNRLDQFKKKKRDLEESKKKLKKLEKDLVTFKSNKELSDEKKTQKFQLISKVKELKKSIISNRQDKEYYDYLLDSSLLLFEYNDEPLSTENKTIVDFFSIKKKRNKIVKISPSNKKKIMNKFIQLTDANFVPNNFNSNNLDICISCNERKITKPKKGVLICPKCGSIDKILVDNNIPSYKEPPREITYFAYKKINHANEFLSQFQAKESTDISDEIYKKIMNELKKERYINIKNITADKIREILKKLELTKYYEHSHYIMNRLSGKPAPILDTVLEDKLRNMFRQVQGPWLKYCPNKRANFFSYPYIFFKFFQLLEEDKYLPYCRLLKSREKLHEHDEVWKRICKDLNWEYIPTV